MSSEGLRPRQSKARASVLAAVGASTMMRLIAMASSLSWIVVGTCACIEGVTCVMVAVETLMHQGRGTCPTASLRLVD